MPSIVWAMLLVIPVALLLRVLIVAVSGGRQEGVTRSKAREQREEREERDEVRSPRRPS